MYLHNYVWSSNGFAWLYVAMFIFQDLEQQDDDPLKKLRDNQKGMVTCRICKGDHWTTKCPYKDTLGPGTMKELEESGLCHL